MPNYSSNLDSIAFLLAAYEERMILPPFQASSKIPPIMRKKMDALKIKTLQALEEEMQVCNGGLGRFLSTDKQSLILLLRPLLALGYKCDSPEFEFINEILRSNDLNKLKNSTNIQSVKFKKRIGPSSFPASIPIGCAA